MDAATKSSVVYLPTEYSQFIHKSRYARYLWDEHRRETWEETVRRYFDFFQTHLAQNHDYKVTPDLRKRLETAVLTLKVMPSMRCLMTAGIALERENVSGYNCSYVPIDTPRSFDEILYILMNGTGVGFSVESRYINQLPTVGEHLDPSDTTIVVPDTKLGWAKGFKELIHLLYSGEIPKWDLSRLRAEGTPLKTFGGRASGPGPLNELYKFTVRVFQQAIGRKLNTREVSDIVCKTAESVVVGGVRRSALICLSDLNDDLMREYKSGHWWESNPQRRLANISYVAEDRPETGIFLKEWLALYNSKSGERGIFSRSAARKQVAKNGRRDPNHEFGTNPCSEIILRPREFCVAGDTLLITRKDGIRPIQELEHYREIEIWNGNNWSNVSVQKTRTKQSLVRVSISDGSYLDCTPDHNFSINQRFEKQWNKIPAENLLTYSKYTTRVEPYNPIENNQGISIENPYTLGFAVGDGYVSNGKVFIILYGEKDQKCPIVGNRGKIRYPKGYNVTSQHVNCSKFLSDPGLVMSLKTTVHAIYDLAQWNRKSFLNFLAGWIDADGSGPGKANGIRLYISGEDRARALQLVCTFNGIKSSLNLLQRKGQKTNFDPRTKDLWYLQITECQEIPCHRVDTSKGKKAKWKGKFQSIIDVEKLEGKHDVYCFTEHQRHKAVFNNILTYQCNLSEVVARVDDTIDTLKDKVEIATILGTWQSTLTNFKYLSKKWKENCDEERLLGVSITGAYDSKLLTCDFHNAGDQQLPEVLEALKSVAVKINKDWAKKLGIPQSAAITCGKPSGTVSQLVDCSSGVGHARHAPFYIRTIRADNKDPLCKFMKEVGFPWEPEVGRPDHTSVFSFPIKAPEGSIFRKDVDALDQLSMWKSFQDHFCEHKPSVTINIKELEWLDVAAWVWRHFDAVSGISFLPFSDHVYQQAPYQDITETDYKVWLEKMPKNVQWERLSEFEKSDMTSGSQELSCMSGSCEIVDVGNVQP